VEAASGRAPAPALEIGGSLTAGQLRQAIGEVVPEEVAGTGRAPGDTVVTGSVPETSQATAVPPAAIRAGETLRARSVRPEAPELAARMAVIGDVEAGDLLVVDRRNPGYLRRSDLESDPAIAGVVSADPGVLLGDRDSGGVPVAFSGVVPCKVDAEYGSIEIGDLLAASSTPGHARRAQDPRPGTIAGKALEPLESGTGVIKVLVMLR